MHTYTVIYGIWCISSICGEMPSESNAVYTNNYYVESVSLSISVYMYMIQCVARGHLLQGEKHS